jgi:outer membrane receptor protein involved in Fe transport
MKTNPALLAFLSFAPFAAQAQTAPLRPNPTALAPSAAGAPSIQLENFVVTGTSIRAIAPVAAPLFTFSQEDIELSGAPSLSEFLRQLPQNTGGGAASDEGRVLGAFFGGSAVSLRGFGPQRTLTLLNGHRIAAQGDGNFVDISFIPSAALEKVEMVPVGASSIYGADAVGGVVNFKLRDNYQGVEARAQTGTTTQGGGTTFNGSLAGGTTWAGGGGLLAYDYFNQDDILAGQRSFTEPAAAQTALVPAIERHSILGSFRQNLGATTRVLFDGYYVSSHTARQSQFPFVAGSVGFSLPLQENVKTDAWGGTVTLQQRLGDSWLAQVIGTYSTNDLEGYDIDTRTGKPTNIFSNEYFARFHRTALVEPKIDGELFQLPGGAVKLALGGQHRHERFDRALARTTPVSKSERTVHAAYSEAFVPLVGRTNRMSGLERLQVSVSGRYERFSNVDETLSTGQEFKRRGKTDSLDPQYGVLYSPTDRLDLRASYGTSFRVAPLTTLRQSNSARVLTQLALNQPVTGTPYTLLLSGIDADLGPETSTYWTIGTDWRPKALPGLRLSLTYYDIDLRDVLGNPSGSTNPTSPLIADFVTVNPSTAQMVSALGAVGLSTADIVPFNAPAYATRGLASVGAIYRSGTTNLSRRLYRGLDFTAEYRVKTGWGSVGCTANLVYTTRYDEKASAAQPAVDRLDTPFQPLNFKARLGGFLSRGGTTGGVFLNYADSYQDNRFATIRGVNALATVDATLALELGQKLGAAFSGTTLRLSAQNLFDRDPPSLRGLTSVNNRFTGDLGYDVVNATARGRYLSVSATRKW